MTGGKLTKCKTTSRNSKRHFFGPFDPGRLNLDPKSLALDQNMALWRPRQRHMMDPQQDLTIPET